MKFELQTPMNKKLKKLLRDPKAFILDSRPLRPIVGRFHAATQQTADIAAEAPASEIPGHLAIPGLETFSPVGENWLHGEPKPIAILWGFNPWKREFVSRYLTEYRVAYVRGRTHWSVLKPALDSLDDPRFIAWGTRELPEAREYAAERSIPLYRMEDGFIRSAALGSTHSTALSLVLDTQGIYFDATRSSDLETLLNNHDFSTTSSKVHTAKALINILRDLRVSKYNLGSLQRVGALLGPRLKRRVLVVGQVEDDASIRLGLAEGWTNRRLIELARRENPGAEIVYKPHPDVAKGFRGDAGAIAALEPLCRVLTVDLHLADLFSEVDHVYTITSTSGFEALMHGLPVTTVGAPFYSGWGLTDDRVRVARRKRTLLLEEMVCCVYLLYPRYLADLSDSTLGCLATILSVTAKRRKSLDAQTEGSTLATKNVRLLMQSDYWLTAFRPDVQSALENRFGKKLASILPLQNQFQSCNGEYFQRSLAYLITGKMRTSAAFPQVLNVLKSSIRPDLFEALLVDLWSIQPSALLLNHWADQCEKAGRFDEAKRHREHLAFNESYPATAEKKLPIPLSRYSYVLKLAQLELRRRRIDNAYVLFNHLLLSGHLHGEVIAGISEIANLKFDFQSSSKLLSLYNRMDPAWKRGQGHVIEARACALIGSAAAALESAAYACDGDPQYVESISSFENCFNVYGDTLPISAAMLAATELNSAGSVISRARALIAQERPREAEFVLLEHQPAASEAVKYCHVMSMALSYQGRLADARTLLKRVLLGHPSLTLYRESLRVSILLNDYKWAKSILSDALSRGIDVGEMYYRKIAFALGDIQDAYRSFRDMGRLNVLRAYLGEKYIQSLAAVSPMSDETVVIAAYFGPGDEIRFASLYREMRERCGAARVVFTCDPRLLGLLQRHYCDLEFAAVARVRNLWSLTSFDNYCELPGSDLHTYFDNSGWRLVDQAHKTILVTDAVSDVVEGYNSFKGAPYLQADPVKVRSWLGRLDKKPDEILVGLSWRSSLTTYSRNEHYFSVENLVPLFDVAGVRFVNLQYDECSEEVAWLQKRFPGRLCNFPNLDQFNDLEGVASLMMNLDLVIAPATTVFELSGALGVPTWLLSNSSELHWRKRPGSDVDAWHDSLRHIEGANVGDKGQVIAEAKRRLSDYVVRRTQRENALA